MAVQVSSIGKGKDFEVKSEISADKVDVYFADIDGCHALCPLQFEAHLCNRGKFISLEADLSVRLALCCYRCGTGFERDFSTHLSLKLIEASSVGSVDEIILSEDDLDTVTYQDPVIELEDLLLESVYLEFDDQCLCSEDCKGLCLQCGKNLNEGPCSCSAS